MSARALDLQSRVDSLAPARVGSPQDTYPRIRLRWLPPTPSPLFYWPTPTGWRHPLTAARPHDRSPSLELRLATPSDADAVAAIHTASWRTAYRGILDDEFLDGPLDSYSRDRWRAWFTLIGGPPAHLLLAELGSVPVGFLCVVHSGGEFGDLVANLHVLVEARRGGVGRQLLREGARLVQEQGHSAMHLWVYSTNSEAIRFYEREGGYAESEQPHLAADGQMRPSRRYVWRDLSPFLD